MHHFTYVDDELWAEGVPVAMIATAVGTPFYCYSTATLERHYQVFRQAMAGLDARICYAVKANSNLGVLATLAAQGSGADVVSEGELRRALAAGIRADGVVFSGIGKSRGEIAYALQAGILQINIESEPELRLVDEVARGLGRRAPIALRVNPDVEAGTHDKISTGRKTDKFGIAFDRARELYRLAGSLAGIDVASVAVHIGSQITSLEPFEQAFARIAGLVGQLRADGHAIRRVDLGGGLGVPYVEGAPPPPLPADYGAMIKRVIGPLGCQVMLEPGRLIVGNAGILVASVLYLKETEARDFLIVDAAMNDLMRPALYGAWHEVMPVRRGRPLRPRAMDLAGPVCESSDILARDRMLPALGPGDLVALGTAGAYGAAMASSYNSRALIPEVLVRGEDFQITRRRPSYEEMLALESLPAWSAALPPLKAAEA